MEKETSAQQKPIKERISIEQFLFTKRLRPEIVAGFKQFVGNVKYDFPEVWENVLNSYINRDNS